MTERAFLKFTIELAASVAKVICAATTFLLSPNFLHTSDTYSCPVHVTLLLCFWLIFLVLSKQRKYQTSTLLTSVLFFTELLKDPFDKKNLQVYYFCNT